MDVERSRCQFEQQESLVEQLRQVLAEEKSVQQLMDAELTRCLTATVTATSTE